MRLRKNIIVFVISAVIIAAGLFSSGVVKLLGGSVYDVLTMQKSIPVAINEIDYNLSERLSYHSQLLDLNSVVMRATGTNVVKKDNDTVVLGEDNYLYGPAAYVSDDDLSCIAGELGRLKEVSESNGAGFLYVLVPSKNIDAKMPAVVNNYAYDNYQRYVRALEDGNIGLLDLYQAKCDEGISNEEMFFITDHHWKPEYGFWANGLICKELENKYGFNYDSKTTDLNNYNVENYNDWFLGSYGKKIGRYFSPLGIDDISVITPRFETSLIEEQPFKNLKREGDFTQTALYTENIDKRDLHNINAYALYSGGDFRLQKYINNLADNNDRILVVRDSSACVITPFLALNAKELYVTDVRNYSYYVGDKLNLENYIKEIKPDYVIVIYNGVSSVEDASGRYDFF